MAYRNDRDITREIPNYRRILIHLNQGRHQGIVWFTQVLDVTETLQWLERHREETGQKLTLLHILMTALGRAIHAHPSLNRYVQGWRIYQRDGVTISISAKKKIRAGEKVVLLKVPIQPDDTPSNVGDRLVELLKEGRGDEEIAQEKETRMFLKIPGFLLHWFVKAALWLDARHWLPGSLVDPDPFFTTMVIANLGSVGLEAGYHHLYEWGNASYFAILGKIKERPVVRDGEVVIRKVVEVKYTFDERSEDALATAIGLSGVKKLVENPDAFSEELQLGVTPPEDTSV